MHRRVFAMLVRYDGGPYKGWQPHPVLPTVGGLLAAAVHRAGVGATPYGASRTDAGVSARAQVASFSTKAEFDPRALHEALRRDLPRTVQVLAIRQAHRSFHSHWSSCGKVYRYRISFSGEAGAWRLPAPSYPYASLDPARLGAALACIREAPDVSAMAEEKESRARRIDRALLLDCGPRGVTVELKAAGFGKYLVRHLITGALGVAVGALNLDELDAMLAGRVPRPPRAEAEGLTLHQVLYPPELDPFPDVEELTRQA